MKCREREQQKGCKNIVTTNVKISTRGHDLLCETAKHVLFQIAHPFIGIPCLSVLILILSCPVSHSPAYEPVVCSTWGVDFTKMYASITHC